MLLAIATFVVYIPALNGSLLWDDDAHITKPENRSFSGLVRIWTTPGATQQYYPLVHSTFWVAHRIFGDTTTGYHLLNILLHVLSALLLVKILRYLGVSGAWLAGGLFALHPVMAESVAWITELKNTLSGVFFLATTLVYLRFDRERSRRLYAFALALFVLGLLSKSVTAILPVPLLALFWWKRGTLRWREDVVPLLPFFAVGIGSGLFTAWMESSFYGAQGAWYRFTIIERCLIAGRALWFYAGTLVFPVNLMFIYPRWEVSQAVWWQYLFPIGVLAAAGVFWFLRKRTRAPLAVAICFSATLFPVLGFFNVYPFRFSFVADHFQYLASIGPIAAGAAIIHTLSGRAAKMRLFLRPAVYGVVLALLGAMTWQQSAQYTDVATLYRATLQKNPACWLAYNNLGLLLAKSGNEGEALTNYQKALAISPSTTEIHNNIGNLFQKTGRIDEAIEYYRKALEINPDDIASHNNLGSALLKTGRIDEAQTHFRKAFAINPNDALTLSNLGNFFLKTGQTGDAITYCEKALKCNPGLIEAHNNLGILLAKTGRPAEAAARFQKALHINPHNSETYYNLGILMAATGRIDEAIFHYRKAVELNPGYFEACNNLGTLLKKTGRIDEAVICYRQALGINPRFIDARCNLGNAMLQTGQITEAMACYLKALEINPMDLNALSGFANAAIKAGRPAEAEKILKLSRDAAVSAGQEALAKEITRGLEELF